MKSLRNSVFVALFSVVWLLTMTCPAYGYVEGHPICGYIDPGTGSFMIQVLIGTALGSLFALKMFWRQITGFVGRLFGRKTDQVATEPHAESEADREPQEGSRDG